MTKFTYKYEPPLAVLEQHTFPGAMKRLNDAGVGGFDVQTRSFSPMCFDHSVFYYSSKLPVNQCDVFDAVTAALEAGCIDDEMWPTELFADMPTFKVFVEMLASYEECFKLRDPWWQAFKTLLNGVEEEGYATAEDLALRFREALAELPKQWTLVAHPNVASV